MMDNRNLEKALDIYARLIVGEEVSRSVNIDLYEDCQNNAEVYDILAAILKKSNLSLYEYNNSLFVTAGEKNRVFGFTNEELKKAIGLRLNKELFLSYFIIYHIMTLFYKTSADYSSREYVKLEEILECVSASVDSILARMDDISLNEAEAESLLSIANLWAELPLVANLDDTMTLKAARGSRTGMVKLTLNFLASQDLFIENGDNYYARDRFRALAENYYDDHKGRLYDIVTRGGEAGHATHEQNSGQ